MTKIGIITDIHNGIGSRATVEGALGDIVDRFNDEFEPDYTVVLGDIIEDTDSRRTDIKLLREVTCVLDGIDSPVRYMAGNHDPATLTKDELRTVLGNDLHGATTVDDRTLIFLDSSAPRLDDPRGEVEAPQLTWLDEMLVQAEKATLFVHHPIHYCDLSDNHWFATTPEQAFCGTKAAITEIIDEHDVVDTVFNGHIHETHHVTAGGIEYLSLNAFNKAMPGDSVTGTHGEVTIDAGEMTVEVLERCESKETFTIAL